MLLAVAMLIAAVPFKSTHSQPGPGVAGTGLEVTWPLIDSAPTPNVLEKPGAAAAPGPLMPVK